MGETEGDRGRRQREETELGREITASPLVGGANPATTNRHKQTEASLYD